MTRLGSCERVRVVQLSFAATRPAGSRDGRHQQPQSRVFQIERALPHEDAHADLDGMIEGSSRGVSEARKTRPRGRLRHPRPKSPQPEAAARISRLLPSKVQACPRPRSKAGLGIAFRDCVS